MKHVLSIEGMSCGHCVATVREALMRVPGVSNVEVSLSDDGQGRASVEGDVTLDALVRAVEAEDYRARAA